MKILFEDSPNSPISKLISMYMDNCVFVSSWHNIEANMDDTSIAFLDVSPNNKKTIWAYRDLTEMFPGRIFIYPCAEFPVVFMLMSYGFIFDEKDRKMLVDAIQGNKIDINVSLEVFCKQILNSRNGQRCTINKQKFGNFYLEDCKCRYNPYCKHIISAADKYNRFIGYAPINWCLDSVIKLYVNLCDSVGIDSEDRCILYKYLSKNGQSKIVT